MFSATEVAFSLVISATLTAAGDICAYTSRGCVGTFGCCTNIPANVCCLYPDNYGWSNLFKNMTSNGNWWASMYSDTCQTLLAGSVASADGQICLGAWDVPARSTSWRATTNAAANAKRSVAVKQEATHCMSPNVIGFTTDNGEERLFRIPGGTRFEDAEKLLEEGQFEELFKYEKGSSV
ncbi:hypothetical protein NLJ89_g7700 [Agrocybe chaxingu]|uniref:Uncharacterized protein n=1 Tax=Agrocybe chaxingu TaxID=84603 RepID=A0A9W8JWT6_9AGAR|nr:hypothetical protein NLJ89_g7700 [Agrocybe chaxingu]